MAQARIAGQHFAYRPPCAKLAANPAERFVRNACHGGKCNGVVNEIAADVHDVCAELKGLKLYNFLSNFSNRIYMLHNEKAVMKLGFRRPFQPKYLK